VAEGHAGDGRAEGSGGGDHSGGGLSWAEPYRGRRARDVTGDALFVHNRTVYLCGTRATTVYVTECLSSSSNCLTIGPLNLCLHPWKQAAVLDLRAAGRLRLFVTQAPYHPAGGGPCACRPSSLPAPTCHGRQASFFFFFFFSSCPVLSPLAVQPTARVCAWGRGEDGQLGLGSAEDQCFVLRNSQH